MIGDNLGELLLRAYIERLDVRWAEDGRLVVSEPGQRPVTATSRLVRLDDTGRPGYVPLAGAGGDRADHERQQDVYVPPLYPVDEPPTWRACCSCGWEGPQRYGPDVAGLDLPARDYAAHRA